MTVVSNEHGVGFNMDRLYKSYVTLGLTPQNEDGTRTMPVARFDTFEVRLIEFADRNRRDSLWIGLYRHDTQSSIDSCRCRGLDEAQNFGEYLISEARGLFESNRTGRRLRS
jgi:hypothetical protein